MEIEDAPVEIEACDVQETTDLTRPPSDHTSPSRKLLERLAIPAGSQDPTIANLYQCLQTMASSSEETSTEFMAIYSMLEGKLQTVSSSSGSSSEQKPRKDPFQEGSDMYINSLTLSEQRDAIKNILANAATAQEVTPKHLRIHTPKDMTIQLMEHQKLGVEWMLNMERGSNKGGILADDMGKSFLWGHIKLHLNNGQVSVKRFNLFPRLLKTNPRIHLCEQLLL